MPWCGEFRWDGEQRIWTCLGSDADAGKRVKKAEDIQEPENDSNDHECVQDRLDLALHRNKAIDQPEQDSDDDQDFQQLN